MGWEKHEDCTLFDYLNNSSYNLVHSMVFSDGLEHLDRLLQKSLRYKHY